MQNNNKTYVHKKSEGHQWYFIDARNQILGRLSTCIAQTLKNKYNTAYTPYKTDKLYVIVINAAHVQVSGQKKFQKFYYRHSGRPGGLKKESFAKLQQRKPKKIIEKAVRGMLPKNALGRELLNHLKVYPGSSHPHDAQQPIPLDFK